MLNYWSIGDDDDDEFDERFEHVSRIMVVWYVMCMRKTTIPCTRHSNIHISNEIDLN